MLAQGLSYMTLDRLFHQSDDYRMPICKVCGIPAIDTGERVECRICQTSKCEMVPIPFGTKLLNQEFMAFNVVPRLITK
jgi:DNA-directed RNA polymerase II subunit RPB2